jgi:hypothetical protein
MQWWNQYRLGSEWRQRLTSSGIKLLGDRNGVIVELLQEGGRDGEEIYTSQSLDLPGL